MPKLNPYLIPKENKVQVEEVREIENEYPSFEEFMKTYENDEKTNDNYELEVDSYGDIREPKKSGPMFNLLQVFQSLQQVLEYAPRLEHTTRHLPDITQAAMETGRFMAEHSNELVHVGRAIGEYASSSSSSALTTTSSYVSENRVTNPPKTESPVWKGLKYHSSDKYGNAVRTNGKTGSMDPMTGEMYKGPKGHELSELYKDYDEYVSIIRYLDLDRRDFCCDELHNNLLGERDGRPEYGGSELNIKDSDVGLGELKTRADIPQEFKSDEW
ncbi:2791_t:CDS:2 [Ambispora gerdemannii]|uniref:2791_t:CDS:1 n=1 Tax=Ambispora gerdemannii TaxID=144530 RepID=A0A9N9DXB1_9GLOM|nr:2791_t:CDS:2 [Ambispora gerdemannii]